MTMTVKAILARFNGDKDKTEKYCLSVIQEYMDVIDAIKVDATEKSEAAHAA